jgi:uncharacterized protein YhaN
MTTDLDRYRQVLAELQDELEVAKAERYLDSKMYDEYLQDLVSDIADTEERIKQLEHEASHKR